MGFFGVLEDILFKVAGSAASSAGRTIDRNMKSGNLSDEQRARMQEKRDEMRAIHDQYKEREREKEREKQ